MRLFAFCWLFIAGVSGYDTYRSLMDVESLLLYEMNLKTKLYLMYLKIL